MKTRKPDQGSALLIVIVLTGIMATYIVANTLTLHHLRAEIKRIEMQQQKHWEASVRK